MPTIQQLVRKGREVLVEMCIRDRYDGGTGEAFEQQATVGVTYMLKLGHMVEDLSLIHI